MPEDYNLGMDFNRKKIAEHVCKSLGAAVGMQSKNLQVVLLPHNSRDPGFPLNCPGCDCRV